MDAEREWLLLSVPLYRLDLQRWLNKNPIQEFGGLKHFDFVGNNPILIIDFFGLAPGDCYKNKDDAAKQALKAIYPLTKKWY
jgi:hypothetical protein